MDAPITDDQLQRAVLILRGIVVPEPRFVGWLAGAMAPPRHEREVGHTATTPDPSVDPSRVTAEADHEGATPD